MRLLVLRPEPDASETAARLARLGHRVLVDPMLAVKLNPEPPDLPEPAAILFTSRNAVRSLAGWPQAAGWHGRPAFAVGPETAAAARSAGFGDVRAGSRDVEALAGLVAGTLAPGGGTILYPAARDRAGDLEGVLATRGFSVRVVEAYSAMPAERLGAAAAQALGDGTIDGVLAYSRRTAETFRDLARLAGIEALPDVTVFALSEAVAEPLRALRPAAILVAARPDGGAILALIPPAR